MTGLPSRDDETSKANESFLREVAKRRERRDRNASDRSFWLSVASMGTVGWTVSVPTAAGALFGRWLDGRLGAGHVFMVFFLLLGLASGCFLAWRLVSERL